MKTAIKLILIDLLIAQIVAPILIMIPCTIYLLVTTGDLDKVFIYGKPAISVKRKRHGRLYQCHS